MRSLKSNHVLLDVNGKWRHREHVITVLKYIFTICKICLSDCYNDMTLEMLNICLLQEQTIITCLYNNNVLSTMDIITLQNGWININLM